MADHIHRVTLFKLPKSEDVQTMVEQYKILDQTNQKVPFTDIYSICLYIC